MTDDCLMTSQSEFDDLCEHIVEAGIVAFDTEFISEYTFDPELCLLQFATRDRSVAVCPFEVKDLTRWWEIMADDDVTVVGHGAQAEIRFCKVLGDCLPKRLVDVQLAEGLRGTSYPLAHATLTQRVTGRRVRAAHTRADWRVRPLTPQQLEYALDDVEHLLEVWDRQSENLTELGRMEWCLVECDRLVDDVANEANRDPWERVSGIQRLDRRPLAIARELAVWRAGQAKSRNIPTRRVLRDDLLVDISNRQPTTVKDVLVNRDMKRPYYREHADQILAAVDRAREIPDKELPRSSNRRRDNSIAEEQILTKVLNLALANRCAEMNVAPQLVGTSSDIRDLIRWFVTNEQKTSKPRLLEGWRSEVCGNVLTDLLSGRISLRIADPKSDYPLQFTKYSEQDG